MKKRITSLLLVFCLLFTLFPATAMAVETDDGAQTGLCPHHTQHDETCGYAEAVEGVPCTHVCSVETGCITIDCVHTHDDSCGWTEEDPAACDHTCTSASGCVSLCCIHEHDGDCGYEPGSAAVPCGFVCEECAAEDDLTYSDTSLALSVATPYLDEGDIATVTLTREGDVSKAASFTVVVYDNSTNYGDDYRILYNGTAVQKIAGAASVYDTFRDNGELTDGIAFDLAMGLAASESQQSGEAEETIDVSAADVLAQLDELEAKAVEFAVTFAAGERTASLTIEVFDDEEPEYEETFLMAVLDGNGDLVGTAQQAFAIEDNDYPAPSVSVSFDCDAEMELTDENQQVELTFRRTGDLATTTLVVLYVDGEAYGKVDFAPWQEIQKVDGVLAGVYTLTDMDGQPIDGQVEVFDDRTAQLSVADGADPVLDAVPEEYAVIRTPRADASPGTGWMPAWATGREGDNENQTIIMGSKSNNLFNEGGSKKSDLNFYAYEQNYHELTTSGTGSHMRTGWQNMDKKTAIDLTGVESVESTMYITGLDENAEISMGIQDQPWNTLKLSKSNGNDEKSYTITAKVFDGKTNSNGSKTDNRQASKKVYFQNMDPDSGSGGTNLFVPNALKLNLRKYRFIIEDDATNMGGYNDHMKYGSDPYKQVRVPTVNMSEQFLTINTQYYGTNKGVVISYGTSGDKYPAQLVGYRLKAADGTFSDLISLTPTTNSNTPGVGKASFTFDKAFLRKYEAKYATYMDKNNSGAKYWTFTVIPIYQKISVEKIVCNNSTKGGIYFKVLDGNGNTRGMPCIGDQILVYKRFGDLDLSGVWYQATDRNGVGIRDQQISENRPDASKNEFTVDMEYPYYKLEGSFSAEASRLMVFYAEDDTSKHGTLQTHVNTRNEAVSADQYMVNDFVPLMASANEGYVTRWRVESLSDHYYGNVYYYQLDGHPDHNIVYVDFVPESEVTQTSGTLSGTLSQSYVQLRSGGYSGTVKLANTAITINADKTYSAVTDANGRFSIPNFKGVEGATYSMAVVYGGSTSYTTFTYYYGRNLNIEMTQFPAGVVYPVGASAYVTGESLTNTTLTLNNTSSVVVSTNVYVPAKNNTVTGVKFYFADPTVVSSGMESPETVAYEATYQGTNGSYQVWGLTISDTSSIISGQRLYVEVLSDKTTYTTDASGNTTKTTMPMSTGLTDTGYDVATNLQADEYSVIYDVPSTPSMQSVSDIISEVIPIKEIPVLGNLDLSVTSKTGGFFSQRSDSNGDAILICGSSYLASFGSGTVAEKLAEKQKTKGALVKEEHKAGAANADVTAVSNSTSKFASVSAPSKFLFNPAFLFKFTFSPKANGKSIYISRYEMALGVDASYIRNIPFSIYGIPFYVCLNIAGEAYFDVQATFGEETDLQAGGWDSEMLSKIKLQSLDTFLAAPALSFTVKGGVGYNAFLSLYLTGSVTCPFIFALVPDTENGGLTVEAAAKFGFTIGAGADVVLFSGQISASTPTAEVGNKDLFADLKTITAKANSKTAVARTAGEALEAADLENILDSITFAPMLRTTVRQASGGNGIIAAGAFKNTGVHLLKLSEDDLLAFYLQDNKKDDTLNYLTVAYAESTDGGETWGEAQYVSDNTLQSNTSLQFDVNLFQLDDRILVTWSEANFDEVLNDLDDVDITALTPAQIARCMDAMDLKGRFFKKNGTPMGDAFTIAENSTVACGALDAVQNGDMVYVYYQRNAFPWDETTETVTLSDLLSTDRTIAMARANVNDTESWTSTKVRATKNGTEQEYRITEVEPFVHDGIMGEILELDRDGKLAEWDEASQTWIISNEDRQLYLRTYDFDADGTPQPSALMAITDPADCARDPQVVSNDEYLHLFWNQNGKVVYLTDFVATDKDTAAIQNAAYVVKGADGTVTTHDPREDDGVYGASYIAGDDDSFHIGTTFSASMDDDGHVLLSWVSTAPEDMNATEAEIPTDKICGVVLETVKGDEDDNGIDHLSSRGTAVALTDSYEAIGALDSVFLGTPPDDGSNFLLAFSTLNDMADQANSAAVRAEKSVYAPDLEITAVNAPSYPMPGSQMTASVTVANRGLGEATNVAVDATGVGEASATIRSILPGCSETVELTVSIPADFNESTFMTIRADDTEETVDVLYGPYFVIKSDPVTSNVVGTRAYRTETEVYNAGNAPGVPALDHKVSLFARSDPAKEYPTCTATTTSVVDVTTGETTTTPITLKPGDTAIVTCVLEDTPVTSNDVTGTLTTTIHVDGDLGEGQYDQCQLPRLTIPVNDDDETDNGDPGNGGSSGGSSSGSSASDRHSVTVGSTANGTVTVSPRNAKKGDTATITTHPDAGYETGTVTVTDRNGNNVKVTKNSDGSYSFTMPSTAVTVAVTFVKSAATDFTDVPKSAYFHDPVLWAAEKGITGGVTATTFAPYASCTRAQIVTFLWRAAGCPAPQSIDRFTDVPDTSYYAQAVAWAVENGITTGITDTTFQPDAPCTRAQAVAFLFRYAAANGMDAVTLQELVSSYSDADQVPGYAASAFNWALAGDIVQGNDGALMANGTCTRAQIVTFLYRFLAD